RQTLRGEDVGQLTVGVFHQRDERRAVRIVFDALDRAGDVELAALEVDDAIALGVAAAAMARRDVAVIVAPARGLETLGEALDRRALPQLATVDLHDRAKPGAGGSEGFECHGCRRPWRQMPVVTSIE